MPYGSLGRRIVSLRQRCGLWLAARSSLGITLFLVGGPEQRKSEDYCFGRYMIAAGHEDDVAEISRNVSQIARELPSAQAADPIN